MPSDIRGGRGRSAIVNYRVKCGKKDLFDNQQKFVCIIWIKEHQREYNKKLRIVPPNY
jgi:hypothetical protein